MRRHVNKAFIYSLLLTLALGCKASEEESPAPNRPRIVSQSTELITMILSPEKFVGTKWFYYPHNSEFYTVEQNKKEKPIQLELLNAEFVKTSQFFFDDKHPNKKRSIVDKAGVTQKLQSKAYLIPKFDEQKLIISVSSDSIVTQATMPKITEIYETILYFKKL